MKFLTDEIVATGDDEGFVKVRYQRKHN